jgi:hypothetical protein
MSVTTAAPNRTYYHYVDEQGINWNVPGDTVWGAAAASGGSAAGAYPAWGRNTKRRHVRYAVFQDPTSFRTRKMIVYTAAAFTALTSASTLAVQLVGASTPVTYKLIAKIPEKQPLQFTGRHDTQDTLAA